MMRIYNIKNLKKIISFTGTLLMLFMITLFFTSCNKSSQKNSNNGKIKVTTTTSMLTDLVKNIGGDKVEVVGLMGEGVDPHLYNASAKDINKLNDAQIIFYGGLHLEGKMEKIFENLEKNNKNIVNLGEKLDKSKIIYENDNIPDPHIWFDIKLWSEEAKIVAEELIKVDNKNNEYYKKNLEIYLNELEKLELYSMEKIKEIPEESRILITAHDAFSYFGKSLGLEVKAIQGVSTDSEAGTKNINDLANFIVENNIKSIFVESSVPKKSIEALQEGVKSKGKIVNIGGELYSDSLGDEKNNTETYIKTFKYNIDTIVNGLK